MDMTELRKSLRKQKLERQGLTLSTLSLTQATGTSDDEDEASTPSGDNAERSLASTFGGSTDNIPQDNTFLQAALDGPGRNQHEKSKFCVLFIYFQLHSQKNLQLSYVLFLARKSLSAIHNTEGGKLSTSISKSFANSKKEELMKVINDAKQKLQKVSPFSSFPFYPLTKSFLSYFVCSLYKFINRQENFELLLRIQAQCMTV